VQTDWEPDGALRDIYVQATSEEDWQRVVDVIRSRSWPSEYTEDGDSVEMPALVGEIFRHTGRAAVLWQIHPTSAINVNCHFFTTEEIEFDLAPREIVGQAELDVVCEFVRTIGQVTDKPVVVCWENMPDAPTMVYEPATDSVTAAPDEYEDRK
jgi:hypothetical protein